MSRERPFRFGLKLRQAASPADWAEAARRAEALGYSSALLPDHFGDQLAPLLGALAAAQATERLRVGTSVLSNDFRHPVVLAKEAASVDRLSGGRLELGIGAGWKSDEYAAAGLRFDPAWLRIERLEEALQILRGLFGPEAVDFRGRHYTLSGVRGSPRPARPGGPPIFVGGGGRRLLGVAGRRADIVGINPAARSGAHDVETDRDAGADRTDLKLDWLREAAGERFESLEIGMNAYVALVTEDRDRAEAALVERFRMPAEQAREVPYGWAGSVDRICEHLERCRERWCVSYWVVPPQARETLAPVVERMSGR
ncbi:MAG: TIGR03621 family F420-dependent LLM class oxidoreductase [Proteobacteria bacterium]|nr:TIGR03621 family F420-dependent LLM class oxidoreductase [Pseudomonadota bacterium]